LGVLGNVEHVMLELLPGYVDLEGLTERCGSQPQLGGGEQCGAHRLSGAEPIDRLVAVRGENEEFSGIVCRAVSRWLAGLAESPGGEVAQSRRLDEANGVRGHVGDGYAVAGPGMAVGPHLEFGQIPGGLRLGLGGMSQCGREPLSQRSAG
jgi:hypothetical protein